MSRESSDGATLPEDLCMILMTIAISQLAFYDSHILAEEERVLWIDTVENLRISSLPYDPCNSHSDAPPYPHHRHSAKF